MMAHRNINPTSVIVHENGEAHLNGFHLSHNTVTDLSFTVDTTYASEADKYVTAMLTVPVGKLPIC